MNYLITQPNRGTLFTASQEALEDEFRTNQAYPLILRATGIPLIKARNWLVKRALEIPNWDIMIMVDDDVVLPKGAFKAFQKQLETCDIAIMDYPHHYHELLSSEPPTGVTVFTQYLPGEDIENLEVAWSGLGATALKRETLEKLNETYPTLFKASAHPVVVDGLGRVSLHLTSDDGLTAQGARYSAGEDTAFFFDARKIGLKVKLIPDLVAQHLRLEFAVSWASNDKYSTSHTIGVSKDIFRPGNELHRIIE